MSGAVNDFLRRRTLARLGFTSPLSELTADKADELCMIAELFEAERAKAMNPKGRK